MGTAPAWIARSRITLFARFRRLERWAKRGDKPSAIRLPAGNRASPQGSVLVRNSFSDSDARYRAVLLPAHSARQHRDDQDANSPSHSDSTPKDNRPPSIAA